MANEVKSVGVFDRVAGAAASAASRAPFFVFCVLLVVIWAPSIFLIRNIDTWQLIINTATTIITFLLVALLQNSQARAESALQLKLDVVAEGLRDLMDHMAHEPCDVDGCDFSDDIEKLERAIGIEEEVGAKGE